MMQLRNISILRLFVWSWSEGVPLPFSSPLTFSSPGFLKDDFMTYLNETCIRRGDTALIQNRSKFMKVSASSGYKNAVEQILASNEIRSQMTDLRAVTEVLPLLFCHDHYLMFLILLLFPGESVGKVSFNSRE
jgi:hypothetical protein